MAPSLVLSLVQRLPEDSLTTALAGGGRHLFGYTRQLAVLHDLFDALNVNTQATGNWKKQPPDFPLAHRPISPDEAQADAKPKRRVSVAQLHAQMSMHGPGGV